MKILLIDVFFDNASTGKIVKAIQDEVIANGDCCITCYAVGKKSREQKSIKFAYDFETLVHAFLSRITGLHGCFSPFSTRKVLKTIKKYKPDIVNIHDPKPYYFNYYKLFDYLAKKGIKTILSLHSMFFFTGKCGSSLDCEKWKTFCEKCPRLNSYPKTLLDRTKFLFFKKREAFLRFKQLKIVCPSNYLSSFVSQSFLSVFNSTVIFNGVDTKSFYPDYDLTFLKEQDLNNKKIVLTVAPNIFSAHSFLVFFVSPPI